MPIATNPSTGEVVYLDDGGNWSPAQTSVNPETREMLAFDGKGWSPVPVSKGVLGYVDDAVRSIASGITFGWADEIAAKLDEAVGRGGNYEQNVAKERARDAQIPVTIQLPGEIAGAVGSTVLTMPLGAIKALAGASAKIPQWMRFAGLGAAEGAAAGAGGATEGTRVEGAAVGAGVGAGVGAVAPTVVRGVTAAARGVRGALQPESGAVADIGRAMVRDEMTPATFADRFIDATAERPGLATVADAGGENVRGLLERVAQTPGAGRTTVVPALTRRQEEQATRISTDLRDLTGTDRTARQAIEDTVAERSAAAKPLYDEAFNFNAREAPDVVRAWQNATSTGYGKAIVNSSDFRRTLQTEYGIKDAADAPLMVQIDAFKKLSDDAAATASRAGNNNRARVVAGMRDDLLGVVDEANDAYRQARAAWAGPSQFMDAIDAGRSILSPKVGADELSGRLASLSDSQREGFRIGAVSSIIAKMGNDPARLPDMTKYLRSPEVRAKVAAMMPTPEAAQAWARRLDFEVGSSKMVGDSLGNSATARRLAEQNDAKGIVGDLVTDALLHGPSTVGVLSRIFTAGPKWLRDTLRSKVDKQLADILTNPERARDLPRILDQARRTRPAGSTRAAPAATAAGTITAE